MKDNPEFQPLWHGMVAGGSSALFSRLFTYPPDTVKSRLQLQGSGGTAHYTGTLDAFVKIAKAEGVGGLYRGFGAIVLTVIPANMCYFSGYELGKRLTPRDWGVASDLMTATIAQTVAGVVFCPIDIVKQRVQTAHVMAAAAPSSCGGPAAPSTVIRAVAPAHMTPAAAVKEVWAHQGLKGFFRGYWTMNALWMPWNLIYLTLYEAAKRRVYVWQLERTGAGEGGKGHSGDTDYGVTVLRDRPISQIIPAWAFPICSSSCATVAAVATHPIDVVKTRLQVLSAADHGQRERSAFQVARELWAQEGPRGFTRGLGARVTTLSMGSSMSWFTYEMVKRHLAQKYPPTER